MSRWFRHYAGMMRDEKLVRVAIKSKQAVPLVLWIWGAILESAAEIDDEGRYDLDPAEAAYFLRSDEGDISAVLDALADAGRLAEGRVVHWGDRQFTSDRSATRVAAYRERKRAEKRHGDDTQGEGNADVTLQQRHRIAPETETETEGSEAKASSLTRGGARAAPKPDRPAKGHRLPADWRPELLTGALSHVVAAWPPGALERELARFRDWAASATGQNALKSDWQAAWRNWIRKCEDDGRYGKTNGSGNHGYSGPRPGSGGGMGRTEAAARGALAAIANGRRP